MCTDSKHNNSKHTDQCMSQHLSRCLRIITMASLFRLNRHTGADAANCPSVH